MEPQERCGSELCVTASSRDQLFEGSKALKSRPMSVASIDTGGLKAKRAGGLERGAALQREKNSEGENPKNA
jgi:hypothetical protein